MLIKEILMSSVSKEILMLIIIILDKMIERGKEILLSVI